MQYILTEQEYQKLTAKDNIIVIRPDDIISINKGLVAAIGGPEICANVKTVKNGQELTFIVTKESLAIMQEIFNNQ